MHALHDHGRRPSDWDECRRAASARVRAPRRRERTDRTARRISSPKRGNTASNSRGIIGAQIARALHAGKQHRNVPRLQRRQDGADVLFHVGGRKPAQPSLPPNSTIAASGLSVSDQSSRASPPALVSPETPALITVDVEPLRLQRLLAAGWENRCPAAGHSPAIRLSPSARMRTGAPALSRGAPARQRRRHCEGQRRTHIIAIEARHRPYRLTASG